MISLCESEWMKSIRKQIFNSIQQSQSKQPIAFQLSCAMTKPKIIGCFFAISWCLRQFCVSWFYWSLFWGPAPQDVALQPYCPPPEVVKHRRGFSRGPGNRPRAYKVKTSVDFPSLLLCVTYSNLGQGLFFGGEIVLKCKLTLLTDSAVETNGLTIRWLRNHLYAQQMIIE